MAKLLFLILLESWGENICSGCISKLDATFLQSLFPTLPVALLKLLKAHMLPDPSLKSFWLTAAHGPALVALYGPSPQRHAAQAQVDLTSPTLLTFQR